MLKQVSELFAGRWQIPLALAAAVVASVTLVKLIPPTPPVQFDALLADVALLEQAGDIDAAADAAANLLKMEPPLSGGKRALLHDRLAGLIYKAELGRYEHNPGNIQNLLSNQQAAWDGGVPWEPEGGLRVGMAHRWLGNDRRALEELRGALQGGLRADDRRIARRAVIELLEEHPEARLERRHVLKQLLDDSAMSPEYVWWALRHGVSDALGENDTIRARELLQGYGDRLGTSDLKGYVDYLWALVMVHEGRPEEAEPVVRWIDDWLGEGARSTQALDRMGHLPSLNRWLLGRVQLAEHRPQDALTAFDEALRAASDPALYVAASVGRGEALAELGRHGAALEAFRRALEELEQHGADRSRAVDQFRRALHALYERQRELHDHANALSYLALAAELVPDDDAERQLALHEELGNAYRVAADGEVDPGVRREYHAAAGRHLEKAADLVHLDEPRLVSLLWAAADAYDAAGLLRSAGRILERFVRGRAEDERMPLAMLRLGQACESEGDFDGALEWYAHLTEVYPRLLEAKRAKVLRAGVLIALGADRYDEAERVLGELLEEDDVAPDSPVFHDALLTLCELLYHQGRYGEAISRLGDFLTLYPDDLQRVRGRFMLADAYRRSAQSLMEKGKEGSTAALQEGRRRLRIAAELFSQLIRDADAMVGPADESRALYTRLALFYRGDCLFELNEPDTLQAALAAYRNAAARYAGDPAALTAHVQIANIHLQFGDVVEAARALEKAHWLLRTIPRAAFERVGAGSHEDWQRYLSVVSSSSLFREVFVGPR